MRKMNKNGQEEMVGFVLIVVIVAIVLVILLGIVLRQDKPIQTENQDINNFIKSSMEYTSSCALNGQYLKMRPLLGACYKSGNCDSGEKACNVLNASFIGMLESSFIVKEGSNIRGYIFKAVYYENISSSQEKKIIEITKGNCTGKTQIGSDEPFAQDNGIITAKMSVCY